MATQYDLNEIFDALAAVLSGVGAGYELGGIDQQMTGYAEVTGELQVPAAVLELESISWDETMGGGRDTIVVLASILLQSVDARTAQRNQRSFLSRTPSNGLDRLKAAIEEDTTLGGLVSFVEMSEARRIGTLTYDGVDYLGAEISLEVVTLPG